METAKKSRSQLLHSICSFLSKYQDASSEQVTDILAAVRRCNLLEDDGAAASTSSNASVEAFVKEVTKMLAKQSVRSDKMRTRKCFESRMHNGAPAQPLAMLRPPKRNSVRSAVVRPVCHTYNSLNYDLHCFFCTSGVHSTGWRCVAGRLLPARPVGDPAGACRRVGRPAAGRTEERLERRRHWRLSQQLGAALAQVSACTGPDALR